MNLCVQELNKLIIFVAREANDLIFKIIILHEVPQDPQVYTQCFSERFGGGGGGGDFVRWRFREVDLTPPRRLVIS